MNGDNDEFGAPEPAEDFGPPEPAEEFGAPEPVAAPASPYVAETIGTYVAGERQLERERDNQIIREAFDAEATKGLDEQARVLRLADKTHRPTAEIEANLKSYEAAWETAGYDPEKLPSHIRQLLLDDPRLAGMVWKDKPFSDAAFMLKKGLGQALDLGSTVADWAQYVVDLGGSMLAGEPEPPSPTDLQLEQRKEEMGERQLVTDDDKAKAIREAGGAAPSWERIKEQHARSELSKLQARLRNIRTGQEAADDLLSVLTGGMFRAPRESEYELEKQIADAKNALRTRDVGGGVGVDLATGVASSAEAMGTGLSRGAPAALGVGLATLALTRSPAAAKETAKLAGQLGFTEGIAEHTFDVEGGQAYGELLEAGVSEPVARGASYLNGAANTAVELGLGAESFVVRDALKRQLRKELLTPATEGLAKRAAKAWVKAGVGEDVEEGVQAFDDGVTEFLAKSYDAGALDRGPVFDSDKVAEAMIIAAPSSLALGIIGPAVEVYRAQKDAADAKRGQRVLAALPQFAETELAKAVPSKVAGMVADMTSETGAPVRNLYLEGQAFLKLFQDQAPAAAEELLGPTGPSQLQQAVQSGGRLEVPLEVYLEKLGATPAAKQLEKDTAVSPLHMTARQQEAFDEALLKNHAKAITEENKQEADAKTEAANALVDQLEEQVVAATKFSREQARSALKPFRAAVLTNPDLVKDWIGGVFAGVEEQRQPELRVSQEQAPSEQEKFLRTELAEKRVDKARVALVDDITGLRSRRAFEQTPVPEGMQVAVFTSPDTKPINDNPEAGHEVANDVMRAMSMALAGHNEAARGGTNFYAHVKDGRDAQDIRDLMQKQLGSPIALEMAIGKDLVEASERLDMNLDKRRLNIKVSPRGKPSPDLDVKSLQPKKGKVAESIPEDLAKRYSEMADEDFFNQVLMQPNGMLTREGRDLLPKKAWASSLDLRGLRDTNKRFDKATGDKLMTAFEAAIVELGGKDFQPAHLSGDEYELQGEKAAVESFVERKLVPYLKRVRVEVDVPLEGGTVLRERLPVQFRYGFGLDYATADKDLNRRKAAEEQGDVGGDLGGRGAGLGREGGTGAPGQAERAGEADGGRAEEAATDPKRLKQGERGAAEFFTHGSQRVFKLILNKGADVSTVLHESGHIFLEMLRVAGEDPTSAPRTQKLWADAKKALGVEGKLTVEQHERFARGFERYLMEGHAPSAALVGVFQRFKLWLKNIYKVASSLNVEIDDELRSVFDRLLATDREIFRQQSRMGLLPMFRDPATAGMTPEQWEAYLEVQAEAAEHTQRAAEKRALEDRSRHTEQWWKDEEKALREAAEEAWEQLPARRAAQALRGKLGEAQTSAVRLDKAAVEKVVGKEAAKKFLTKKDGADVDDVAATLTGYPTGEAMLKAIAELPEKKVWAKQQAAEQMRAKHPDVLEERDELRRLVQKGLHGDYTAQWLLKEWSALRAKTSQPWPPVEAIRLAAQQMISNQVVGRLAPGTALANERAAADKAAKAAAAGDYAQAAVFKQQQLLNFYLWRELTAARQLRDGFLERAQKAKKDTARAKLGKAHELYRDGVDLVLETFGLKEPEAREKELSTLDQVVGQMVLDAQTVGFDEAAVAQLLAQPKSWKQLTVAQLRAVDGAMRNIQNAAKGLNTVLLDGKAADFEEVKQQLLDEADEAAPDLPALGASVAGEGKWKGFESFVAGLDGESLKPELMLSWLGNRTRKERLAEGHKSVWYRAIVKELQHAKAREVDLLRGPAGKMLEALERLGKADRKLFTAPIDGKALFPGWAVKSAQKVAAPTKRYELLMLALNYGNESNAQRIRDGYNVTDEQMRAALDLLTPAELEAVQAVWDANEKLRPLAFDLEEQETGLRPKAIPARALKLKGGELRGGYHPLVYDPRFEKYGQVSEAKQLADLMDPSFTRPGTSHGHLKSRADNFVGAVSLDPNRIAMHVIQAAHDIAFRRAVKSAGRLLLDKDIQAKLKSKLLKERSDLLVPWLRDIGQQRGMAAVVTAGKWNRVAQFLNAGKVYAVLGYSLRNAVEDLTNLPASLVSTDLKSRHLTAALLELLPRSLADLLNSPAISEARGLSGELRTRQDQMQRELAGAIKNLSTDSVAVRGLDFLKDHAFILMEASDKFTSTAVWLGRYRQGRFEGENEVDAIEHADAALRKVFAGHSAVDRAAVLRDKGWAGTVLRFYSFLNNNWNVVRDVMHDVGTAEGAAEASKAIIAGGARILALAMITGALSELLRGRGPEDGEPPEEWLVRKTLLGALAWVPFGGDFGQAIESGILGKQHNPRAGQIAGTGVDIYRAYQAIKQDKSGPETFEKVMNAVGGITGLPQTPIRQGVYLYEVGTGQREPEGAGELFKGAVYGQPPRAR